MPDPRTTWERVTSGESGARERWCAARSPVGGRRRPRRVSSGWRGRVVLVWMASLLASVPAGATSSSSDYNPKEAGHPLRIVAYVLHPVGLALDTLVFRPAHWLGSREPFKTLVGNTD